MAGSSSPGAIPVRIRVRDIRQMCIEADPDFHNEGENPVEYEFTKRTFRGRYKYRGAYASDE